MSFDYGESLATANELIDEFGKDVTLLKRVRSGPTHAPVYSDTPFVVKCVELAKEKRDKSGTLTGTTSRRLLIAGDAAASPEKDDKVIIGGKSVEIDVVKTLNPADTVVLYTVWLKS